MTSRRDAVGLLCLAPIAAQAKPTRRVYRVGVLETTSLRANAENFDRFRKGLEERGYVEGPSLVIAYRSAEGRTERFAELAAELVRAKVDLIVTRGTPATLAAKARPARIPIVMAAVADPVESGLAASLARPGGNVTGLTSATTELAPKRLELLKALVPKMTRVAVIRQPRQRRGRRRRGRKPRRRRARWASSRCCSTCAARRRSRARSTRRCAGRADALLVGIETARAVQPRTRSSSSRRSTACRRCTRRASSSTRAASCPTA